MKRKILALLFAITLAQSQDVDSVISKIWRNIGGKDTFSLAKQLSFTFVVERQGDIVVQRRHIWNMENGDYVLQQTDPNNANKTEVYFNINTKQGSVLTNSSIQSGEEVAKTLNQAYARYINDTYWLLAPVKLTDPGVNIRIDKKQSTGFDGTVLLLSFDDVGLTPGDQYSLFVDPDGSIKEWHYVLESGRKGAYIWQEEVDCGAGLRFSTTKISKDGNSAIVLRNVHFSTEIDPDLFKVPMTD